MSAHSVLSAAGKVRAAYLHGNPEHVITRKREELALARALDLLEKSGALPLSLDLCDELHAFARGV